MELDKSKTDAAAEDTSLISKREVLTKYGISYGTLYRWKRMGLIPDEWFIKKSVFTGQETFFPREPVTNRIELIMDFQAKGLSLDEIQKSIVGTEKPSIIITAPYGETRFYVDDVVKITYEADNTSHDITVEVKRILSGLEKANASAETGDEDKSENGKGDSAKGNADTADILENVNRLISSVEKTLGELGIEIDISQAKWRDKE